MFGSFSAPIRRRSSFLTDASGSMQTRDVVSTNDIIVPAAAWIDSQNKRAFWTPLEEAGSESAGRGVLRAAGFGRDERA